METTRNDSPTDAFLDDAAANAIGSQSAQEAAQFADALSAGSPEQRKTALELQDAVARLSAASPYMEPPERVRAGVLAATAPATFKMKDYRRKADIGSDRYLRWGLVAASLCLVWAGYDLYTAQTANTKIAATAQQQARQIAELQHQLDSEHIAISQLVDPNVRQVNLLSSADKKVIGKMLINSQTNQVTVVMPDAVIPPGSKVVLTVSQNGQKTQIAALAVGGAPGSAIVHWQTPPGVDANSPGDLNLNDGPKVATFNR